MSDESERGYILTKLIDRYSERQTECESRACSLAIKQNSMFPILQRCFSSNIHDRSRISERVCSWWPTQGVYSHIRRFSLSLPIAKHRLQPTPFGAPYRKYSSGVGSPGLPLPTPRLLEEKHLLLHDGIVFKHAERPMGSRPDQRSEVAGQGHGDEADRDGARLVWLESVMLMMEISSCAWPKLNIAV